MASPPKKEVLTSPTSDISPPKTVVSSPKNLGKPIVHGDFTNGSTTSHKPLKHRMRRGEKNIDIETELRLDESDETSLSSIESPFQVQEYLAMIIQSDPHNVLRIVSIPGGPPVDAKGKSAAFRGNGSSDGHDGSRGLVDENVWLYEHLRRMALDLSHPFITSLQEQCTRDSCPEMKAGEWLYLCAAHATVNEHECCAIDYITHTLDGATALLNSTRYFPSRLSIADTSLKHFTSIVRRLYRIFAHTYFHHRDLFEQCESETSLYARFLLLATNYELISPELIVIPADSMNPNLDDHDRGPTPERRSTATTMVHSDNEDPD